MTLTIATAQLATDVKIRLLLFDDDQAQPATLLIEKKRVKGYQDNRKSQRFRRKCRSKGMNNQAIEMMMLIKKAKQSIHQNPPQVDGDEKEGK